MVGLAELYGSRAPGCWVNTPREAVSMMPRASLRVGQAQ